MNTNRLRLISIALVVCMFAGATHVAIRATIAAEPPEKPTFTPPFSSPAVLYLKVSL